MSESPSTRRPTLGSTPTRHKARVGDARTGVTYRSVSTLMPGGYSSPGSSMAAQHLVDAGEDSRGYFCPVCGTELSLDDFTKREADYYCPYCSTRQTPAVF